MGDSREGLIIELWEDIIWTLVASSIYIVMVQCTLIIII